MPIMNGFDATRAIRRAAGDGPRVLIIALTASVMPEQRRACQEVGMDALLAKPMSRDRVQATVMTPVGGGTVRMPFADPSAQRESEAI